MCKRRNPPYGSAHGQGRGPATPTPRTCSPPPAPGGVLAWNPSPALLLSSLSCSQASTAASSPFQPRGMVATRPKVQRLVWPQKCHAAKEQNSLLVGLDDRVHVPVGAREELAGLGMIDFAFLHNGNDGATRGRANANLRARKSVGRELSDLIRGLPQARCRWRQDTRGWAE